MDNRYDLIELVTRMARIAYARNRDIDRETRYVTITDDEAVALIEELRSGDDLGIGDG
jgi:hypothetical protein